MRRYIDADAVLTVIEEAFHRTDVEGKEQIGVLTCHRIVRTAPTADVVEVVRCKDCKKWEQYENTSGAGYCHNKNYCFTYDAMLDREFTPITMPEDFCSYGERRSENEG